MIQLNQDILEEESEQCESGFLSGLFARKKKTSNPISAIEIKVIYSC